MIAMPVNALMMPTTVPNRPMNGAVEPIVARPPGPFFISAEVRDDGAIERASDRRRRGRGCP